VNVLHTDLIHTCIWNCTLLYPPPCLRAGRLSKDEIEKMVRDAEKYKEEDEKQRDRLQAKNALEGYAFNMKQTIEDDKLKDKISEDDRKSVLDKCNEVISWIDHNQVSLVFILYCIYLVIYLEWPHHS